MITIEADVDDLKTYASSNPAQGSAKWVGLVIDTNEDSIIGISFDGYPLTQADVEEAASIGIGAGKFVLWLKAEDLVVEARTFTLSEEGKEDTEVTVELVDIG